jgi:carboxypeptidase C (cathepsin A)
VLPFTMSMLVAALHLALLYASLSFTEARRILPHERSLEVDDGARRFVSVDVPTDPDDHLVKGDLPLLAEGELKTKHWAGLLPANDKGDKYLFYWLFEPDLTGYKGDEAKIPLLIWLNGGES